MSSSEINLSGYRRALGCFATGVAVVTTRGEDGQKSGITINSFNSVSLDPPLVLWNIARDAQSFAAFIRSEFFAVNVLSSDQQDICDRFAAGGSDKFNGLDCGVGHEGQPILPEFSASFQCRKEHVYDGGDHQIVIGRVLRFEDRETDPLIFYRGHYLIQANHGR
jgi:3-hydroxy-9,10-secoandrosta-1,3,5(10)-triene-9,17-dione monooxygenase reductase component